MRILLSGQKYFGAETLRLLLAQGFDVCHVTAPKETERGTPDKLWRLAELYNLPLSEAKNLNASTLPENIDLIVCAHSHAFISEKTRLKTTYGAVGYHPSLLPLHRGRDSVKWTVKMGDKVTGGTVFWLSNKVDGGDSIMIGFGKGSDKPDVIIDLPKKSAPTSSARSRPASPRTTPATRRRSPTTWATTSVTAPAWHRTCSSPSVWCSSPTSSSASPRSSRSASCRRSGRRVSSSRWR